jgi:hypothetical protein
MTLLTAATASLCGRPATHSVLAPSGAVTSTVVIVNRPIREPMQRGVDEAKDIRDAPSISEGRDNNPSDGNLRAIDEVRICL